MSGTINLSLSQQFDSDGKPLSGGKLYFFATGSSTPQSAFQDTALTIPHPNPITLDASGRIPMFYLADGSIKVRLDDKNGLVVFQADGLLVIGPSGGGGGGGASVDPTTVLQTGDIKARFAPGGATLTGFVRCNGNTIGSNASGANELADPSAQALFQYLWTTNLPMLTSGGGAATKTTASADWAGNNRMTLPDLRGRTIAGLDDMGATAQNRLTAAFWGADAKVLGNVGGNESASLATTHLPAHTHGVGTLANDTQAAHRHSAFIRDPTHVHGGVLNNSSLSVSGPGVPAPNTSTTSTSAASTGVRVNDAAGGAGTDDQTALAGSHSHVISGSTGSIGSGTAHASATPSMVMCFYIKL